MFADYVTIDFSDIAANEDTEACIEIVLNTRIWPFSLELNMPRDFCKTDHDACLGAVLHHLDADRLEVLELQLPSPTAMYPFIISAAKSLTTLDLRYTEAVQVTPSPFHLPSMPYLDHLFVERDKVGSGAVDLETAIINASRLTRLGIIMPREPPSAHLQLLRVSAAYLTDLCIDYWQDRMAMVLPRLTGLFYEYTDHGSPRLPATLLSLAIPIASIKPSARTWLRRIRAQCRHLEEIRLPGYIIDARDSSTPAAVTARQMAIACAEAKITLVDGKHSDTDLDDFMAESQWRSRMAPSSALHTCYRLLQHCSYIAAD